MSEFEKNSPKAEKENSSLISRRAAINALDGELEVTGEENAIAVVNYLNAVRERIKCLPAAGSMWIPCSERLPTKTGHYLCSFKKPNRIDNIFVDLAYWTGGRWYGYLANEINAWMPMPEPWKGGAE